MEFRIDGEPTDPKFVWYQELGFGQPVPESAAHVYLLRIEARRFFDAISNAYTKLIEDQRRDDVLTGKPSPEYFRPEKVPGPVLHSIVAPVPSGGRWKINGLPRCERAIRFR